MMIEDMVPHLTAVMSEENMTDPPMIESVNVQVPTQVIVVMVTNIPLQLVDIPVVTVDMGGRHQKGSIAARIATAAPMVVRTEIMTLIDTMGLFDIRRLTVDTSVIVQQDMTEVAAAIQVVVNEATPLKEATH